MTTLLVEIDRFGFQIEQSGKLLIDIVIWIVNTSFYWNMLSYPQTFRQSAMVAI